MENYGFTEKRAGDYISVPMLAVMATLCPSCGEDVLGQARFCHHCGQPLESVRHEPLLEHREPTHTEVSQYAPIWRRGVAATIDIVTIVTVVLPGVIAFFWLVEVLTGWIGMEPDDGRFLAGMAAVLLWLIADWLYHAMMHSSPRQGTYGKYFMGLKVTGLAGEPIGFGQATGRHFAKFLSTFPLMVGFFIAPFTRRKQALHDMVAGTLVVRR
jgi:uncharacterized RDD family membrane protein YckC